MTLFIVGGFVVLLAFVAVALLLFLDVDSYKTQLETAASERLGMETRISGDLGIRLFPRLQITLEEVRLANQGADVVTIKEARFGIGLLPLLAKKIEIRTLTLVQPKIFIERDRAGNFNVERPETAGGTSPGLDYSRISITEGTFHFADQQSGASLEALDCGLTAGQLQLPGGKSADILQTLSFTAEVVCGEIRTHDLTATDVKFSANGKPGLIDLDPVTMQVFAGRGSGSVHADFSGAVPRFEARYALPQFRIEEFFKTLAPQKFAEGSMDFTANLTMQGRTWNEIKPSVAGQISLRGENLNVHGRDLDQEFDRFESSQSFNLVDVGAIFIAGPFGLLVTKGYNFASILQGPGGESEIRHLRSDWQVDHGTAMARDVALATGKHRVALQGELDFVNEKFDDVTVALIDAEGCTKVRQTIQGSFQKPEVEQPSVLKTLTGPVRKLIKLGKELFPGGECEAFYAGSVAAPK
jgi:AsmA protein